MIGALIGDIAGSRFEFHNIKSKDFTIFHIDSCFTDDSVMTLAVAKACINAGYDKDKLYNETISCMQELGNKYSNRGYGGRFKEWLKMEDPKPYGSYGNGAAMRVSPVAYVARSLEEAEEMSDIVTSVTHNDPVGMEGARATTDAIYLALHGATKEEIRDHIRECYYDLSFTIDEIRFDYAFFIDCARTVSPAIECFLESTDFEDAIRLAVSIGGDSDTVACITGSIAGAYYGVPKGFRDSALGYFDEYLLDIIHTFETKFVNAKSK